MKKGNLFADFFQAAVGNSNQNNKEEDYSIYSNKEEGSSSENQEKSGESSFELEPDEKKETEQDQKNIEKLLDRLGLKTATGGVNKNHELEMVVNNFVENCIETVDHNANIEEYNLAYDSHYQERLKAHEPYASSIYVSQLTELESIMRMSDRGIKSLCRSFLLAKRYTSMTCQLIVEHPIFQGLILLVIMLNSLKMATDDPLATTTNLPWAETTFTAIYVSEMALKIMAYGFLLNSGAYLRDSWNIMDFCIVLTSLLPMVITINFSVNALRAFRVLRPLRTITKIRALKMIMKTLFYSFSLVMDSFYILLFVIFVLAIAGMQLFGGNLKFYCMDKLTGAMTTTLCGTTAATVDCSPDQLCAKGVGSPNFSVNNFDTLLWSVLNVFQSITLEGWSQIMQDIQLVSGFVYCVYSLLIVFICEYVLLNMTMAILKYKYAQVKGNVIEEEEEEKEQYQPDFLKKIGVFNTISAIARPPLLVRTNNPTKHRLGCSHTLPLQEAESSVSVKQLLAYLNQQKLSSKLIEPQGQQLNIEELRMLGKLAQHKWDAKQLQFETNNLSQKEIQAGNLDQKPQSDKTIGKEEESYLEESFDDSDDDDNILSVDEEDSEEDLKQKQIQAQALQAQQRLNKNGMGKIVNTRRATFELPVQESNEQDEEVVKQKKKRKTIVRELSELDKLLSLIGGKAGTSPDRNIITQIPEIDLQSIVPQRVFERFADLGDHSLKHESKANELKTLEIRAAQKKLHKEAKKRQIPIQAAIEESALDLKELHLKNELQKKALRCRVKPDEVINKQRRYDLSRVIVSMTLRAAEEKKEEIEENMSSLTFNVRYLPNSEKKPNKPSIYMRNLQKEKLIMKLPEHGASIKTDIKRGENIEKGSQKTQSHTNLKYLRMLQNYQMEDRIELTFDRVNSTFFKPQRPKKKQEQVSPEEEYQQIIEEDILKRHGRLQIEFPIEGLQDESSILGNLNMRKEEYDINIRGMMGLWRVARKQTLLFVAAPFYDNFMLLVVIANTSLMAMSGFVNTDGDPFVTINFVFSILFAADLGVKVFAYGVSFFSDVMNLFDALVVVISLIQMTMGGSNLSALRSIRILRAFRVLRITRLIRSLSYMRIIMNVVASVISEFVYVFLLLFLFIFIFTLLGMQIFGGGFVPQSVSGIRQNYDTFFNAFFTIFQVMTVQNWNDILTATCLSRVGPWGSLFLIGWIFLGNWILLSLLQAILLDGFDDDSTNPEEEVVTSTIDVETKSFTEDHILQDGSSDMGSQEDKQLLSSQSSKKEINYDVNDASLFIFKPQNFVRRFAIAVTTSTAFEVAMFIIILCSSGKLALDTYIDTVDGPIVGIASTVDYVFNFIFITEFLLKVIARGFIAGEDAYLKNSWNKMDFFIVCMSLVDMLMEGVSLSIIKLLRTLRPLRIITRNEEMKVMVTSLVQSILGIFNLLIIVLCVFLMFSILAMNLLQGKLNYCNTRGAGIVTGNYGPYGIDQNTCIAQGGVWVTQLINFQNIVNGMLSLYVFSTRENWPFYVFSFIDASDSGPVKDNNQILYFAYAVLFIFVCSLFFMDLLVGVLFANYHQSQAKIRPQMLSDKQINWQNLQMLIIKEDPSFQLYIAPSDPIRGLLFKVVSTNLFEIGIALVIVVNICVMAINNDDISMSTQNTLTTLNSVCSFIFIAELGVKLITFGRAYFLSVWNVFDFFVVSASILDLILHYSGVGSSQTSTLSLLPQIARIFRVLRITRLLRMLKRFKGLQKLIETFVFSLPAIGKAFSILMLYLFICSVLASNLMGNLSGDYSGAMTKILNYQDFHHAMETLFVNLSGQNWYFFMFFGTTQGYAQCSTGKCTSPFYFLFWLPFMFFGQKVFLELFVLIVLDQFEANYINQHNPLGIFSLYEDDFRQKWIQITAKYHSEKIETKSLINLMLRLRPPLGLGREETLDKYKKELGDNEKVTAKELEQKIVELDQKLKKNAAVLLNKMHLPKNRIYYGYHETFYHFIKLATVPAFIADATPEQLKLIQERHRTTEEELDKLKPSGNLFYYGQLEEEDNLSVPLNPISLILFTQMIVKGWHNYSLRNRSRKTKEDHYNPYDSLNQSCASDLNQAQFQKIPPEKRVAIRRGGLMESKMKMANRCEFQPTNNITGAYEDGKKNKGRLSKSGNRISNSKKSVRLNSVLFKNQLKKKTTVQSQQSQISQEDSFE